MPETFGTFRVNLIESMKTVSVFLVLACFFFGSCKKLVQAQKKDRLVEAMTNGQWHVEDFQEGPAIVTDEFSGYTFQFHENGTVSGKKDTISTEGIWTSDYQNYSISSSFPSDAAPLKRLNGTWKITNTKIDYVAAEMKGTTGKNILHLRKNQ